MASRFPRSGFCLLLVTSLAAHGGLLYGLHQNAHAAGPKAPPRAQVSFRMAPIKPAPEPIAAPEPEVVVAALRPRTKERRTDQQADAPKAVSSPVEAPSQAAAADFTGLTLTNPNGGFATVTGNGEAMRGPIGAPARGIKSGNGSGKVEAAPDAVVGLTSLSRPPRAPTLDAALRANYPADARAQGVSGRAVVRARILADGRVGDTRILIASAPEFGRACQRTLTGSRWSAPLDKSGQPVTTEVSYQCEFEVSQ